jgi:hypothetical protein
MISTNIIIVCFIVEPYCIIIIIIIIIIIMLDEHKIICINNLLNLEKDISVSV